MRKSRIVVVFVGLVLAGCEGRGGGGGGTPNCPYSGGSSCEEAVERTAGSGGLCEDEAAFSVDDLTQTCEGWGSATRNCWTACVQAAGSCDEAGDCQDDCFYCDL